LVSLVLSDAYAAATPFLITGSVAFSLFALVVVATNLLIARGEAAGVAKVAVASAIILTVGIVITGRFVGAIGVFYAMIGALGLWLLLLLGLVQRRLGYRVFGNRVGRTLPTIGAALAVYFLTAPGTITGGLIGIATLPVIALLAGVFSRRERRAAWNLARRPAKSD
jgi:O-antigen/teichoic acid export membrane protein